ncbi:DUF924 family protein [Thioalkalivibrio denitrificans]|uniref:DUF924 family protein n=1 Tax=Thioalkalivibrio denitrificans TaxID=108003 RepID=UPI002481A208|nr:DUF924 family protein [Thioalkalivibrio denitrificans]
MRERFEPLWRQAAAGELDYWGESARGALALAILLDQFPLNMYRNRPESFATERKARSVADAAIERGFDQQLEPEEQAFLYMPFMHSEDLADQERSVELFSRPGLEHNRRWARHHRDIVARFGRFPHRNPILGRESTEEEQAWLDSDDAYRG